MFNIIIDAIVAAAITVSGAACDAGTYVANTAIEVADAVYTEATIIGNDVNIWINDTIEDIFGNPAEEALEETGVNTVQVETILYEDVTFENILYEDVTFENILYEDVTQTWPD